MTLSLGAAAHPAQAQSTSEKAAQKAFDDGMKLLEQNKVADACPKLEESQRLDPAMGTQFRLAECWEKLGRTASAWTLFRQVVSEAQAAGRDDRASVSSARAAALEPRLTRLSILVAPSARVPGLIVRRDGATVEEALWGRGIPVDPGEHLISASAPGKKSWETQQQARSGTVEVAIPALDPILGAAATPPDSEPPPSPRACNAAWSPAWCSAARRSWASARGSLSWWPPTGKRPRAPSFKARSRASSPTTAWERGAACTTLSDTATSAGTLSNAAFWTLLGSGLAAAGAVTYFVWPTAKSTSPSATVVHVLPSAGLSGVGLSAIGTF